MRRKEILFKQLSFIIGILIVLSFIEGKEITLPIRSEIRLSRSWGDETRSSSELIIQQELNEIHFTFFSDNL
jgi:hypothetical protein